MNKQMNIEEHINNLKKYIEEDFAFREPIKNMSDFDKYCYGHCKDIETLLTAYEEKCKELKKEIQDDLDVRNRWGLTLQELEKEKEKNKELKQEKEYLNCIIESDKDNYINKDKIKPIQIIDLDGKIHNVYKIEEE